MKHILDSKFKYKPSFDTDVKRTFDRIAKQRKLEEEATQRVLAEEATSAIQRKEATIAQIQRVRASKAAR